MFSYRFTLTEIVPIFDADLVLRCTNSAASLENRSCFPPHTVTCPPSSLATSVKPVSLQQGLMTPQPSSLRTSFRALSITRIEIKESVIYTAEGDRDSSIKKATA